jgi:ribosomal protein S12 methylthiotransferase
VEVLVEGLHEDSDLLLVGRTAGQAPEIDGRVILNDGSAGAGEFVSAVITESHDYDFVARIVGGASAS